jgi:hypothetical protein
MNPRRKEFVGAAEEHRVGAAVQKRDAPFGDYGQGDAAMKPTIY